jgi:hypothetical protein
MSPPAFQAPGANAAALDCPPGYHPWDEERAVEHRLKLRTLPSRFEEVLEGLDSEAPSSGLCISNKHPEEFSEIEALLADRISRAAAPSDSVAPGAFRAAVQQRARLITAAPKVRGASGAWQPLGVGPLISNEEGFDEVNGLGLAKLNGRIDSLDYDPVHDRLFALIGTGGLWLSKNRGQTWRSIGDSLPTQTNGAVAWSPAGGGPGRLVVVSGEPLMGGNTYTGLGAYWSDNLGASWHRSRGVPDGALGFQVADDPTNPNEFYVGTSMGLFRSTNAGRRFTNVPLPTASARARPAMDVASS